MNNTSRILVVEDDPIIGLEVVSILNSLGYSALGPLASGEEVLKQCGKLKPDAILMDIQLAGKLDGIQTAAALGADFETPIIFLSAHHDELTLQRAKLVRPFGYLIKPVEAPDLRAAIELILVRSRSGANAAPEDTKDSAELESSHVGNDQPLAILSALRMLSDLPSNDVKALAARASIRECAAGELLALEGEAPSHVFVPISGRLSVVKSGELGKELIVALLGSHDPYGLFLSLPALHGSVSLRARLDSRVLSIPEEDWTQFLMKHPLVMRQMVDALAERLASAHVLASSLAHSRVESRLVHTLLALVPGFGRGSGKDAAREERLYLTRKELAELTGTTPETAIRITKKLEREELLDLSRPGIIKIPNLQKLRAVLAE